MVAEVGFEPHDLRVMSPTSYQAALLRDIKIWCRKRESNPYDAFASRDFKSRASTYSATPAYQERSAFLKPLYYTTRFLVCQPLFEKKKKFLMKTHFGDAF